MEIYVTHGKKVLIDDRDFPTIEPHKWVAQQWGDYWYATTVIDRKMVFMHRLILGLTSSDLEVDHKNQNGLDNRRCNIRLVTRSQQHMNQKLRSDNRSGYKGVTLKVDRYHARITVNGKRLQLGSFKTKEEAARAYDKAALEYFGEFARINFPESGDDYVQTLRDGYVQNWNR